MLSLSDEMTAEAAAAFDQAVAKALGVDAVEYCAEPKYDGLSADMRYENGYFVAATTRGDGETGEDVTAQARTIRNLPLRLSKPLSISVRGEVMMTEAAFARVNAALAASGEKQLVNARNGAAGSMRQLNTAVTASRQLSFFAYGMATDIGIGSQIEVLNELRALGFSLSEHAQVVHGFAGIESFYKKMSALRSQLGIGLDGLVIKVNSRDQQLDLGFNHRTPKWAIAYKFPPEEMPTLLEGIDVQIGRTGIATPVARLKPVFVGGVTVTNATLHNVDMLNSKDVRVGDTIIVRRAGDVVPEIVGPMLDRRPDGATPFVMPSCCPVCGHRLEREEGYADYYCMGGVLCSAQSLFKLTHFGSRTCMNIDGLGEAKVQTLLDAGLVTKASDFYSLRQEDIAGLSGFGEQSAANLVNAIAASRGAPLNRFLFALGINGVGEKTAKDLARALGSWDRFLTVEDEELLAISGIGPSTVSSIRSYLSDEQMAEDARKLGAAIEPQSVAASATLFAGKTFVLTGTLPTLSREDATQLIERAGGKVSGSVSKKTFAVVSGSSAGGKLEKAVSLGVEVWDQEKLLEAVA